MLEILAAVEKQATCCRRRVGCVVTDEAYRIIATGYNGNAPGEPHCIDTPCLGANEAHGSNLLCEAIHAEQNALLQSGPRLQQATRMYCSTTPCINCAKLILLTSIQKIIVKDIYKDTGGLNLLRRRGVGFYLARYESVTMADRVMLEIPKLVDIIEIL